jgi:NADH:ubiquinone reductase (H+-translocating)
MALVLTSKAPRVVIVGAGFGGLAAAKRLAGRTVDVTVIDKRNHHLFQPLLYQVATAALSPADIAAPVRSILAGAPNVRVMLDEVTRVDTLRNRVALASGGEVAFDWLILATGARHSYFGRDEWAAHAPGLKSIEDATAIRRNVLLALERAETETDPERRRALLTFVVIGGGPTGVEMAGAIAELARRSVSQDFRSITPHCSRVLLIEAGHRILPGFPPELSSVAEMALRKLGVEIRFGSPVTGIGFGHVRRSEEWISARTIVWAAGVEASPAAEWLGAEQDSAGRVIVAADLTIPNNPHIFAIGDTAACAGPFGRPLPGVAPVAKQQGIYVADRILGRRNDAFAYRDYGNLATIGRSQAVIDWGGWRMKGLLAWLVWSVAHIWFLVGFRSRLSVAISWLWNYLTYQRNARLITGDLHLDPSLPARRKAA